MTKSTDSLRPKFWERFALDSLRPAEWEALCDGCGRCCLNKLEDPDTGQVALTRIACRLLDDQSCQCAQYDIRHQFVPECIQMTPKSLELHAYWLPETCAYRRLWKGDQIPQWHPLITGDPESTHREGPSVRGQTLPEFDVPEEEWENHIIEEIE